MTMPDKFNLAGQTALITGSSRGIGRAIALALAECGATVAIHGTGPTKALDETLAEVRKRSPRSVVVYGDLSAPEVAGRIVAEAGAVLGRVDILVINASINERKSLTALTLAEAEAVMRVNFHASWLMIQAVVPAMRTRKWGRILTIGSVQQARPHPEMMVYAASKSALENLCRNLAKQLGPDGITVNNLAPGVIATDRNQQALSNPDYAEKVRDVIPLRYFGEPDDCAGTAVLLCSEAGRYINGADFYVDGGMRLP